MADRPNLSMPPDEIAGFLLRHDLAVLSLAAPPSPPFSTIVTFVYHPDQLALALPAEDPVAAAVREADAVCCVVEEAPSYYEIRSVIIRGSVQIRAAGARNRSALLPLGDPISFDFGRLNQ